METEKILEIRDEYIGEFFQNDRREKYIIYKNIKGSTILKYEVRSVLPI